MAATFTLLILDRPLLAELHRNRPKGWRLWGWSPAGPTCPAGAVFLDVSDDNAPEHLNGKLVDITLTKNFDTGEVTVSSYDWERERF